jgi:cobalamin synthase
MYLCIGLSLILGSGLPVRDSVWFALAICIILPFSAFAALAFVVRVYRKGVGGYTGDALGAAVELGELFHMTTVCLSFFVVASLA